MKMRDNSKEVLAELDRRIKKKLTDSAIVVERKAKQICPRGRTGALARSITHVIELRRALIGTNLSYGPAVEFGTKPHTITPNVKAALYWEEAEHPVKIVHHPGAQSKPYLRPALEASRTEIDDIFSS